MERINTCNREIRENFYQVLDHSMSVQDFRQRRDLREGTSQWSDQSYNILTKDSNCWNNCPYCYMKRIRQNFFKTDIEDLKMVVDTKKVSKGWLRTKTQKYIMFPTSHDIFEEFIDQYITVVKKIVGAGHYLLIVTKPRLACVQRLIEELRPYQQHIMFRFTITSDDNNILHVWEPNAPSFEERLECLKQAHQNGYNTSVSMEPFLSDPRSVITQIGQYVTDSIWIGTMSGQGWVKCVSPEETQRVQKLYQYDYLRALITDLRSNDKIFWKVAVMNKLISS
jgi:DNA repair photolyase